MWLNASYIVIYVLYYSYSGCSPIHIASRFGHTPIVAYLIAKGCDVNCRDQRGLTPLMMGVGKNYSYESYYICIQCTVIFLLCELFSAGAKENFIIFVLVQRFLQPILSEKACKKMSLCIYTSAKIIKVFLCTGLKRLENAKKNF